MKKLEDMTEPELKELMATMARGIEFIASHCEVEKPLFALLLFNDPKVAQYVGNCRREDMILAFREAADRLEQRQDVTR